MLGIAYKNSDRLILLINDILDMEKIEAGQLGFNMRRLNLVSVVTQAIEADSGYAEEYGVKIILTGSPGEAYIEGDEDRLAQVLSNLISNAAKFSPEGENVELVIDEAEANIRVSVTDHGQGIADDFKDKIFDKFTQADSSDTRRPGGTGLGLSICRSLAKSNDGSIALLPSPTGTTFEVRLPRATAT